MHTQPTIVTTALLALAPALAAAQTATDITHDQIQSVLASMGTSIDQQLKVVDIGKLNLGVGILHRTGANDTDGALRGAVHVHVNEVYYILSGGGTLLTGGELSNAEQPGPDAVVGPTFSADSRNGTIRDVSAGDVVVIPAGTLHAWIRIPDQVTYLSIRPDPDRVLPAGYVHPGLD